MENKFVVGPAVSAESFFGRRQLVDDLTNIIFDGVGARNLVGPTRIGKSSLVNYVFEKNKDYPNRLCVQLSMGKYKSAFAFWKTLAKKIEKEVKEAELWNDIFAEYYEEIETVDSQNDEWFVDFQFPFESVLEEIHEADYRVVLSIDEFDSVERLFDQDAYYYQEMRDMFSDPKFATSGVLISRRRLQMFEATCPYISTFHGVFPEITLLPFNDADMAEFYNAFEECGITVPSDGKKRLTDLTGNMPYLCCMLASRMVERSNERAEWGSSGVYSVFKELRPQIDRHYEDLIARLDEDEHLSFIFYLSIGSRIPNITQRDIENMVTMGILVSQTVEGEKQYYAFSKDFMTYFRFRPLKLPAWDTMMAAEKVINEIFSKEYPELLEIRYDDLLGPQGERIKRDISNRMPELNIEWVRTYKFLNDFSSHKENPCVLDVLTLSTLIRTILDCWDTRFHVYFGGDSEWKNKLRVIKDLRNPMAHSQMEHIGDEELAVCMKYCDELIRLNGGAE